MEVMSKLRFLFLLSLLGGLVACAPKNTSLQVNEVWSRPGLAGGNSAVYFVIDNGTSSADTLQSASSDIAGAAELHMTEMQDGNMQMMQQEQVPVPAGEKTTFEPGGLHVMLIGLDHDLQPGDTFTLTLDFASAGQIPLDVTVREP